MYFKMLIVILGFCQVTKPEEVSVCQTVIIFMPDSLTSALQAQDHVNAIDFLPLFIHLK